MTKKLTLKEISDIVKSLDIAMLTTRGADGTLESRPMSNNKDVDYNGDNWFFTLIDTRCVTDIARDANVCLSYDGRPGLLGKHTYVSIGGTAEIIQDRRVMRDHWVPDLEAWFDKGLDTPGLTLIHVRGQHIRYWHGYDEGEVTLPGAASRAA